MALEEDVRRACIAEIPADASPLTPEETLSAAARFRGDRNGAGGEPSWQALIDYVDLSQLLDIVSRQKDILASAAGSKPTDISSLVREVRRLVPTRNRVCHARPPEPDDLSLVLEVTEGLARGSASRVSFTALMDVLMELHANALYPLTLTIPAFWQLDVPVVDNNLPAPEFSDTGFVGRTRDRENLVNHLLGPHPLVTVTGEGGVGKTSITLRCLNDLLERRDLFDAIVWTSLKTSHLSTSGVRAILGAMTSETDILRSISERFGGAETDTTEGLFQHVLEILDTFNVLLVIDNLETIDRDALRPLFSAIPRRSKIVVTSRIGIGEFELRYPLQPMDEGDAVRLIRVTARVLNVTDLIRRDDAQLQEVANRLFRNPLAIRWFVQSYNEGRSYSELLNRNRSFEDLLQFCFQNLYTTLDDEQQRLLRILVALGQPLSEVQLALLAQVHDIERVRGAIQYLYASNLVLRARDTWASDESTLWNTSAFARQYILSRDKQVAAERARVMPQYRALIAARDMSAAEAGGNPFRSRVIHATSTDEAMVVRSLTEALISSGRGQHREALGFVDTAIKLLPDFFEVWRVSAQVKEAAGDVVGALSDFERALDLADGKSDSLLLFHAQFLARQEQFATARDVLEQAASRADAPVPLVAMFGWMQTLSGLTREGAATFESVHEELFVLSAPGRAHYLTQYAESLRRAAETEMRRQLPREAMQYVLRGLAVLDEARRAGIKDEYVVRTVQHCVREGAFIISRDCNAADWSQFARVVEPLAVEIDLIGDDDRAVVDLRTRCPAIAARPEFAALFPSLDDRSAIESRPPTEGTLKPIPYGRDYGFIAGDDGQDYWVHQAQFVADLSWEELRALDAPRVKFFVGPPVREGRLPRALHVTLVLDNVAADGSPS